MTAVLAETDLRAEYEERGFVVVRKLFPRELMARAAMEAEALPERLKHLVNTRNIRCRWQDNVFTGDRTFETFDPVIDISPVCKEIALAPQLLALLGELYGEPAHLFKDKLIFKPPGVKGYRLHQDWIAWKGFHSGDSPDRRWCSRCRGRPIRRALAP